MAKVIKVPKMVNFIVNITYKFEDDYLVQNYQFMVDNKKHLSYVNDKRYSLKRALDKLYDDFHLDGFVKRFDCEDHVEFYYEKQEAPSPVIRNMQFYLPPYAGCEYCVYAEQKELCTYCTEKQKFYPSPIKSCRIFKSKDQIIT